MRIRVKFQLLLKLNKGKIYKNLIKSKFLKKNSQKHKNSKKMNK